MTTPSNIAPRSDAPAEVPPLSALASKGIALGLRLFQSWATFAYRWRTERAMRLGGVDHLTIPCRDLRVAEDFYVGLLGARVMLRLTAADLERFGRPDHEIPGAVHLSLVFAGGPRLDLFESSVGQPPREAGHPHVALSVPPGRMLGWKKRLSDAGVPTFGPTRLGPPGQASLYFNDPFGNHLELATLGFTGEIPVGPPDMAALAYTWTQPSLTARN
jgi:catechol 2,3-dioxygenase-like lactoylglutathione lyase family enzyme